MYHQDGQNGNRQVLMAVSMANMETVPSHHGEMRRHRQTDRGPQPEINMAQVLVDARTRWLKPVEVNYILCNYQRFNFKLKLEAPDKPQSGSLYMFDKKVVRYFRNDGHNWRKKKDGKTVKEAHEKLKAGGTGDLLHCYYAHAEEDGDFQRRCYWRLDGENEHIVLVHYLQVEEGTSRLHRTPPITPPRSPMHQLPSAVTADSSFAGASGNQNFALPAATPSASGIHSHRHSADSASGDTPWESPDEDLSFDSQIPQDRGQSSLGMQQPLPVASSSGTTPRDFQSQLRSWWDPPSSTFTAMEPMGAPLNGNQSRQDNFLDLLRHEDGRATPLGPLPGDMGVADAMSTPFDFGRAPSFNMNINTDDLGDEEPAMAMNNNSNNNNNNHHLHNMQSDWGSLRNASQLSQPGNWPLKEDAAAGDPGMLMAKRPDLLPIDGSSSRMLDVEPPLVPRFLENNINTTTGLHNAQLLRPPSLDIPSRDWLQSLGIGLSPMSQEMNSLLREAQQAKEQEQRKKTYLNGMFAPLEPIPPPLGQPFSDTGNRSFSSLMMDSDMNIVPPSPNIEKVLMKMHADLYAPPTLDQQQQEQEPGMPLARLKKLDSFGTWAHELQTYRLEQTNMDPHDDDDSPLPSEVPDVVKRESDSYVSDSWVSAEGGDAGQATTPTGGGGGDLTFGMGSLHIMPPPAVEYPFSISDFSPSSSDGKGGTKVLIVGTCLETASDGGEWGVMFGDVEVPAEVVQPGVLRCTAPEHKAARVSFCVTRNDGKSCSEVREFEFKAEPKPRMISKSSLKRIGSLSDDDSLLQIRLVRMLMDDVRSQAPTPVSAAGSERTVGQQQQEEEKEEAEGGGGSKEDEWAWMGDMIAGVKAGGFVQEQLLQMLLKRRLAEWLADKGANGSLPQDAMVSWLDEAGLGALHMVSALGYAWAVMPLVSAGVNVDSRDLRGFTPLHWAAARGREQVVVALIAAGAAPALLTMTGDERDDQGITPAELAAGSGFKGIAAYLTQQALNRSLSSMEINDIDHEMALSAEQKAEETVAATSVNNDDDGMEGPAASSDPQFDVIQEAVRNSAHAAALIQFRYRQFSMRRRQQAEEHEKVRELHAGMDEEEAIAFSAASKAARAGHRGGGVYKDQSVAASATRIQTNFRRWRSRKEFLMLRQRIVRLQAHVRRHLQRQQYQKMRWSLGVLEKAILRWRMKNYQGGGGTLALTNGEEAAQPSPELDKEAWRHVGGRNSRDVLDKAVKQIQDMVRSDQGRAEYLRMLKEEQKHTQAQSGRARSLSGGNQPQQGWEDDAMSTMSA